jgi:NTE family protein
VAHSVTDDQVNRHKKKTISLVLGSGGARGLAHIGVIQVLEEQGFRISSISGSSMGALVGGIYAAGKLETFTDWVCTLDRMNVLRLLDFSFNGDAIFKGDKIINTLRELIGEQAIEELPISFTAVATDLDKSREVWFSSGPLFDAIRASIALPTVFSPFNYRGKTLVDGGLLNPIPIAPTLHDITDLTLAVSLCGKPQKRDNVPLPVVEKADNSVSYYQRLLDFIEDLQPKKTEEEEEAGIFDIISKSIDAMQSSIASFKLAAYTPDIVIEIPRDACSIYEFERAAEMIEIGRLKAAAALENFADLDF